MFNFQKVLATLPDGLHGHKICGRGRNRGDRRAGGRSEAIRCRLFEEGGAWRM